MRTLDDYEPPAPLDNTFHEGWRAPLHRQRRRLMLAIMLVLLGFGAIVLPMVLVG